MIIEDPSSPIRIDAREGATNLDIAGVGPGHRILRRHRFLQSTIPGAGEGSGVFAELDAVVVECPGREEPRDRRRRGRGRPGWINPGTDGSGAA
jgi:hypothetical protein